jgi:hypothetical protein
MRVFSVGVIGISAFHLLVVFALVFYCLDNYYERACPVDTYAHVLTFPMFPFLEALSLPKALNLAGLLINSYLWGILLANVVTRIKGLRKSRA